MIFPVEKKQKNNALKQLECDYTLASFSIRRIMNMQMSPISTHSYKLIYKSIYH